jgi:hypothetical protein
MRKYGIQVADQKNVEDALPKEMLYTSEYQSPKLHRVFKGRAKVDGSGQITLDVRHGLQYTPMVMAYYKPSGAAWTAIDNDKIGLFTGRTFVRIKTDSTSPFSANQEFEYKFWVFKDQAEILGAA